MKTLVVLLCSTVVLVAEGSRRSSTNTYRQPSYSSKSYGPSPGYGAPPTYGPYSAHGSSKGYGSGTGYAGSRKPHGSGGYPSYGYNGYNNFHHSGGSGSGDKPLNEVDKLYETVGDILAQVKFLTSKMDSANALLSVQEKKLNNLIHVILVELEETDIKQNSSINKLNEHLRDLTEDDNKLYGHLHGLTKDNNENTERAEEAENLWARRQAESLANQRDVFSQRLDVRDLKNKLFQVKDNDFWAFQKWMDRSDTRLSSIKKRETRRMCEVGQVTFKADDRYVTYNYHNWFNTSPHLLYGISGMKFNLKAKEKSVSPYPHGYAPKKEPEAIGVMVHATGTKTGLTMEAFDYSFGSIAGVTLDISFQACSIGPGASPVKH